MENAALNWGWISNTGLALQGSVACGYLEGSALFWSVGVGTGGMRSTCDIVSGLEKGMDVVQGGQMIRSEPT